MTHFPINPSCQGQLHLRLSTAPITVASVAMLANMADVGVVDGDTEEEADATTQAAKMNPRYQRLAKYPSYGRGI